MNGLITSLGLMIWVYISMRALYQAEESKTWYGFFQAAIGVSLINYFCFDLILNSANLEGFKQMSTQEIDGTGWVLAVGTVAVVVAGGVRASKRIESPIVVKGAERSGQETKTLKEEMFQLEVQRVQGHISQQDYEKRKEALLQRID